MSLAPPGAEPVPSPCNSVCTVDPVSGWCRGCKRSLDEIAAWSVMSADEKRAVLADLPSREAAP